MDNIDKKILTIIQEAFPICERPFEFIGNELGLSEAQVLTRIKKLKDDDGIIRTISAIYNGAKLGYTSALVAFKVDQHEVEYIANKISNFTGVSHNYFRNNDFNLWFTLSVGPEVDINSVISNFVKKNGVNDYLILPSIKTFKLNTHFNLLNDNALTISHIEKKPVDKFEYLIDDLDKKLIRELQNELCLVSKPFTLAAENIGINTHELIQRANKHIELSLMRRFCASLRHAQAGIKLNAMIVWQVESQLVEKIGNDFALQSFVSHCYERFSMPKWPYNIYTMVHARENHELNANIETLREISNLKTNKILETVKEFKKSRVKYFVDDNFLAEYL